MRRKYSDEVEITRKNSDCEITKHNKNYRKLQKFKKVTTKLTRNDKIFVAKLRFYLPLVQ